MKRTLSLLAALVVLEGCARAKDVPQPPQPPEVSVVTVHKTSVPVVTGLPGRTAAYLVAQVRARVDGIVLKREFTEGGDVKSGQRLYQIDPAPYRAGLDSALGVLQKAQGNLAAMNAQAERYKILVAGDGISKQEYDNAIATQGQAASLDVAKIQKDIGIAQYQKAIQSAFREVADGLAARGTYDEQLASLERFTASRRRQLELADFRYRNGADTYLNVLIAQTALYNAQQALVATRLQRLTSLVDLYRSLGGGWIEHTGDAPRAANG